MAGIESKENRKPKNLTIKQRQRSTRQEELRELLAKKGLVQQVLVDIDKLNNLNIALVGKEYFDAECVKFKLKTDARLKLIAKYAPDMKQQEIVGDGGGPVVLQFDKQDEDA